MSWIGVVLAVVVACTALAIAARRRSPNGQERLLETEGALADEDVPIVIALLADPRHAFAARDRLEADLAHVHPWLLAALDDPALLADSYDVASDTADEPIMALVYLHALAHPDDFRRSR